MFQSDHFRANADYHFNAFQRCNEHVCSRVPVPSLRNPITFERKSVNTWSSRPSAGKWGNWTTTTRGRAMSDMPLCCQATVHSYLDGYIVHPSPLDLLEGEPGKMAGHSTSKSRCNNMLPPMVPTWFYMSLWSLWSLWHPMVLNFPTSFS